MKRTKGWRRTILAFFAALLLILMNPCGQGDTAKASGSRRNLAILAAQWWQWTMAIPSDRHPGLDLSGEFAGEGQPYKGNKVFFLTGVPFVPAERSINVPKGTPFFFPLITVMVWDDAPPHNDAKVREMRAFAAYLIDEFVVGYYVKVNGVDLTGSSERVASTPFGFQTPDDNLFAPDLPGGTYAPAVSDGYWFYLPPLPTGTHKVEFGGWALYEGLMIGVDLIYHITVP